MPSSLNFAVMDRDAAKGLVFVVGCPRSGTSALAWALANHPAFVTGPESNFLWHLCREGRLRSVWENTHRIEDGWLAKQQVGWEEFAAAVGSGLEGLFASRAGGRRWVDSSPENVLIAEDLAALFPTARLLHLVRDGRAVVNSMLRSGFSQPWAQDFDEACRTWAFYVVRGMRAQEALGSRMLTLSHRWLVEDPEATCRAILHFLGEPQHSGPARFLRTQRINSSYDANSREDMKRPKDPARLREQPWEEWPAEWHARFEALAGEAQAYAAQLAESKTMLHSGDSRP